MNSFLTPEKAKIWPEFPTENVKIDIIIEFFNKIYGIELKSFTNESAYKNAVKQAAHYALQLRLDTIVLVFFVDFIDDKNRQKFELKHTDKNTGVIVETIFIECEN